MSGRNLRIIVCVLGAPRSGTTMLASMLASTPETIALPEMAYLHDLMELDSKGTLDADKFREILVTSHRFKNSRICDNDQEIFDLFIPNDLTGTISNILEKYNQRNDCKIFNSWVEHTPHNARAADLWLKYFPQAKFIHIVRDGRGVAESTMRQAWGMKDIVRLAENWNSRINSIRQLQARLGDRITEVRYEDLIQSPESTLRRVCETMGLRFQESMLSNNGIHNLKHLAGAELIGKSADMSRLYAWKNELKDWEILHFTAICRKNLELYHYEASKGRELNPIYCIFIKLIGKIKHHYSKKRFLSEVSKVENLKRGCNS